MRVLLVNSHGADRTYGGAERYVHDLLDGLGKRGHEVALLSAFPIRDDTAYQTVALHDVDWRDHRLRRYRNHVEDWIAAAGSRLETILQEIRPDVVHTSNLPGITTGIWERARRLEIPVVHTLHDYHLLCPRTTLTRRDGSPCRPNPLLCGLRSARLARWGPGVQTVIGVSEHVLRRHEHFFPESVGRVVIRPPLEPIEGTGQKPPGGELATIGYLGALRDTKGVGLLLEAAPAMADRGVTFRVAGDGPMRAHVEAARHVQYEGRVEGAAVAAFLTSCDAGVVPSLWEEPGLTYVVCEWLSAGRPVLATQRGGLAEAVAYGGVMTFDASAAALTTAVAQLRDEHAWRRLVATVPAVDNASDLERWVGAHEAVYAGALSAHPTRASA